MLGNNCGSALDVAAAPSERLSIARRRVARAERALKEWQEELEAAQNILDGADIWPRPQGWY